MGVMTNDTVPARTYTLDPARTTIRCDAKAMMGLLPVRGVFDLLQGEVIIDGDLAQCSASARVAAGSFASGNSTRDGHVASAQLLDAKAYPEITFSGSGAHVVQAGGWTLPGSVTVHKTAQPVEVHVTEARLEDGMARFRATATLDRFAFGLTRMKVRVSRTVTLVIDATGVPA